MVSSGEDWVRDSSDGRLKLKKKKKVLNHGDYQGDVIDRGSHTNYLLPSCKYPQKKTIWEISVLEIAQDGLTESLGWPPGTL